MHSNKTQFTVQEFNFELGALPVLDSIDLMATMLEVFPSLATAAAKAEAGDSIAALGAMRGAFTKVRPLIEAFVKVCSVSKLPEAPHQVPMGPTLDTILSQKHIVILHWLVKCLQSEYADFLVEVSQSPKPPASEPSSSSLPAPAATGG